MAEQEKDATAAARTCRVVASPRGHESGRHIVRLLRTKRSELTHQDYAEMRRVVGYVHRHLAQRPSTEEIEQSRWRYSLMNWGHDPLKGR